MNVYQFIFMVIGVGTCVKWLFDIIDWIEKK